MSPKRSRFLKARQNKAFNKLIETIERVAVRSSDLILLTGPTGAGKSQLASQIYKLKKANGQVSGKFVDVNCATLVENFGLCGIGNVDDDVKAILA